MNNANYKYRIDEILHSPSGMRVVWTATFGDNNKSLTEAKYAANDLYANKSKRIDFWVSTGIYEKEANEQVELRVSLIVATGNNVQEYPVKSTMIAIAADHLALEMRLLTPNPPVNSNISPEADTNIAQEEKVMYAPNGELYNFYTVLDIPPTATPAQIEDAYIRHQAKWQAAMWHQERYKDVDIPAKQSLARLARNVLINPERRARYDRLLFPTSELPEVSKTTHAGDAEFTNTVTEIDLPEKRTFIGWLMKVLGR